MIQQAQNTSQLARTLVCSAYMESRALIVGARQRLSLPQKEMLSHSPNQNTFMMMVYK
jgi:hypothetical protein